MNNTIKWTNSTSNWNGKQLKAVVWIDSDTILECHLWYTQFIPKGKKAYEVSYAERKELGNVITLHVTKMRRSTHAFVGGMGRTVSVSDKTYTRKALKALEDAAQTITLDDVMILGETQTTGPSRVL